MGLEVEVVAETNKFDVIVIGGGIAGMTAAAAVQQGGLKSCFLDKDTPGGKLLRIEQIHNSQQFENMPGASVAQEYMNYVTDQVKAHYSWGNVKSIRTKNDKFYLFTEDGQTWEAKAIILATGTVVKKLNVPGEDKYLNHGLSYCIMCDSSLTKDKDVVVIGTSSHLNLLSQAKSVTQLAANEVKAIEGDSSVQAVIKTDGTSVACQYVFIENGFETDLSFLPSDIAINDKKEIIVDEHMANTFPGVFACGDCINQSIKLIDKAIQQANIAADSAVKYVNSRNW